MAIPDPHMDEMRIMSYDAKPRACKQLYRVPRRNDFIEVLWCLDHIPGLPTRWCTAGVLHISGCPDQGCLAMGVLLYLRGETWSEQVNKVEFFNNHKLRRAVDTDEDTDEEIDEGNTNPNPELVWQFTTQDEEICSDRSDEEWNGEPSEGTAIRREFANKAQHRIQRRDSQAVEMNALRAGHSALVVEVEKLKRVAVKQSHRISQLQIAEPQRYICTSAGCVLPRLRQRLALKMQARPRSFSLSTGKRMATEFEETVAVRTGDGLHVGTLKARVECTLQQFESLAKQLKATTSSAEWKFSPEFSHTRLALHCSAAFQILFFNFAELLNQIGVTSLADRLEMARKCGTGPRGDLLRMLGTYRFEKGDASSAAHTCLGTSCGNAGIPENKENFNAVAQLCTVLTRKSREWDRVDRRFVHGLSRERITLPQQDDTASEVQAFALHWKRAAELGIRTWSRSLIESGQVFGWLEVCLPFIQTQGRHLCTEVGGLDTDEVRGELLGIDSKP